jgi:hypothetical protein
MVLSRNVEHCRICPEQERRLAISGIDVRSAPVDNLVRYDGISRFVVDCLWVQQ